MAMRSLDEPKDPLQPSSYRELQLLSEIETTPEVTQRQLSRRMGIALGLTNVLLRNLAQKGYVRASQAGWKRWLYAITPDGFSHKFQLTVAYIHRVMDHYKNVRQTLRVQMGTLALNEESRVAIYGTGEFAELVYLGLKELGITEIDVFDSGIPMGRTFLGMPVLSLEAFDSEEYDRVLVAWLGGSETANAALQTRGTSPDKLVVFFADATATRQG